MNENTDSLEAETLFRLLSRTQQQSVALLQREIENLDGDRHGLQPGMRQFFCALAREDGMTISEMASRLRLAKSTVTETLKRMKTAGLVRLDSDRNDLRLRRIVLTGKGRSLKPACARIDAAISERIRREFRAEERTRLRDLLERLIAALSVDRDD